MIKIIPMTKTLLLLLLMAAAAQAAAEVSADQAWVRLLPGTLPGAGYVELTNRGAVAVSLQSATSDGFADIELHRSYRHDGVAGMERVAAIKIGPGETRALAPHGYHLMMFDRQPGLQAGGTVPVTLGFSDGSRLTVDFELRSPAGD